MGCCCEYGYLVVWHACGRYVKDNIILMMMENRGSYVLQNKDGTKNIQNEICTTRAWNVLRRVLEMFKTTNSLTKLIIFVRAHTTLEYIGRDNQWDFFICQVLFPQISATQTRQRVPLVYNTSILSSNLFRAHAQVCAKWQSRASLGHSIYDSK